MNWYQMLIIFSFIIDIIVLKFTIDNIIITNKRKCIKDPNVIYIG